MNKLGLLYAILAIGFAAGSAQKVHSTEAVIIPASQSTEVNFTASDGGTIYADLLFSEPVPGQVSEQNESQPFIVLFHQAGSNGRGEYASIIPKLRAKGYNLLVVDQRSGGGYFGHENRTVKARGGKTKYCAAYPDMEAALSYAQTKSGGGKVFAWGSSYSAALVLKLASVHGDGLAGVLSFSPATGRAMGACNANNFIADVTIPALGLRPESEMGNDINKGGQKQRELYTEQGLDYYVAKDGVHGSSMLDPSRAKGDVEPTWATVWAFLDKHK